MSYLRETVVQGKGALLTHRVQEGLASLPPVLKRDTAARFAAEGRTDTTTTLEVAPGSPAAPQEDVPQHFLLGHPVQKYVVQFTKEAEVLHKKDKNGLTACRWPWTKQGGRPRGRILVKHLLCSNCGLA